MPLLNAPLDFSETNESLRAALRRADQAAEESAKIFHDLERRMHLLAADYEDAKNELKVAMEEVTALRYSTAIFFDLRFD